MVGDRMRLNVIQAAGVAAVLSVLVYVAVIQGLLWLGDFLTETL